MRRSLNEIACEDYRSVIVLDISSTAIEVARKHAGEATRRKLPCARAYALLVASLRVPGKMASRMVRVELALDYV